MCSEKSQLPHKRCSYSCHVQHSARRIHRFHEHASHPTGLCKPVSNTRTTDCIKCIFVNFQNKPYGNSLQSHSMMMQHLQAPFSIKWNEYSTQNLSNISIFLASLLVIVQFSATYNRVGRIRTLYFLG